MTTIFFTHINVSTRHLCLLNNTLLVSCLWSQESILLFFIVAVYSFIPPIVSFLVWFYCSSLCPNYCAIFFAVWCYLFVFHFFICYSIAFALLGISHPSATLIPISSVLLSFNLLTSKTGSLISGVGCYCGIAKDVRVDGNCGATKVVESRMYFPI